MGRKKKEKAANNSSDDEGELEWEMEGPDNDKKSSSRLAGKKPTKWRKVLMISDNSESEEEDPEICPICESKNDPVSAGKNRMIGCDGCDKWYHWSCVGIDHNNKPDKNADWFCRRCSRKKGEASEWKPSKEEEHALEILPLREPTRASGTSNSSGNSAVPFRTLAQKKEYDTPLEARSAKAPIQGLVAKPPVLKRDQGSKTNKRRGRPPAKLRDNEEYNSGSRPPPGESRTSSVDRSRTSTPDSASHPQWSDSASTPPPGKKKKKESWLFNKKQSDLQAKLPPGLTVERQGSDDRGSDSGRIPRSRTPNSLLDSDEEKEKDREMLEQRYYGMARGGRDESPGPEPAVAIKEERRDSGEEGGYSLNKPPEAIANLPLNITIQKEGASPYRTPERTSLHDLPPGISVQKERLPPGINVQKERLPPVISVQKERLPPGISVQKERLPPGISVQKERLPPGISVQKEKLPLGISVQKEGHGAAPPVRMPPGVTVHKTSLQGDGPELKQLTAKLPPGITVETGENESPGHGFSRAPEVDPSRLVMMPSSVRLNRQDARTSSHGFLRDEEKDKENLSSRSCSPVDTRMDTASPPSDAGTPTPSRSTPIPPRSTPVPSVPSLTPGPSQTSSTDNLESNKDLATPDQSDNTDEDNPAEPISPRKSSRQGNTESLARIRAALRADSNSDEEFGGKVPVKPRKKKPEEVAEEENGAKETEKEKEKPEKVQGNLDPEDATESTKHKDVKEKRGRKEKESKEEKREKKEKEKESKEEKRERKEKEKQKEKESKDEKREKKVKEKQKEMEERKERKVKDKKKETESKEVVEEKEEKETPMEENEQDQERIENRSSGRTKRNTRRTSSAENLANTTDSSKEDSIADDFASKIPYRKPVRGRKRKADESEEPEPPAPTTPSNPGRVDKSPTKPAQSPKEKKSQSPSKAQDKQEKTSSRPRRRSGRGDACPPSPPAPSAVPAPTSVQGKPTAVVGPVRPEEIQDEEEASKSKKKGRPSKKDKKAKDDMEEMQALQRIANGLRKRKTDKVEDDNITFGGVDSKLSSLQNELIVSPATITKTNDKELLKVDDKIRPRLSVKPSGLEQLDRDWEDEKKEENIAERSEDKSSSSQWTEVQERTGQSSGMSLILKRSNKPLIIKPFTGVTETPALDMTDIAETAPVFDQAQSISNPDGNGNDSDKDNVETDDVDRNMQDNIQTDNINRSVHDNPQIEIGNKKKDSSVLTTFTEEEMAKLPIDIWDKKPASLYSNQSNLAPSMSEVDLEPPGLPADLADVMPSLDAALAMCRDKEQKKTEAEEIQKIKNSLLLDKHNIQAPQPEYAFPQMPSQNMGWQVGGPTSDHQYLKQAMVSNIDHLKPIQGHPLFPNATFTSDSVSQAPANVQTSAVHTLPPTVGMPRSLPSQFPIPSIQGVGIPRGPLSFPIPSTQDVPIPPLMSNNSHPSQFTIKPRPISIDSGVGGSPDTHPLPQSSAPNPSSEESDVWNLFEKEIQDFADTCDEPPNVKKEMQDTKQGIKILKPLELNEKAKELQGQTITVKDNLRVVPKRTDGEAVLRQFQIPTGATAPVSWNQPMSGSGVARGIVVNSLGSNIMGGQNIVVAANGPTPAHISLPQSANVLGGRGPVPANIRVMGVRGMMPANINVVGARGSNTVLGRVTPPFPGSLGSRMVSTVQVASRMQSPVQQVSSVIMAGGEGSQSRLNFPIRKSPQEGASKALFLPEAMDPVGSSPSNPRQIVVHMSGQKVIIPNPSKELQQMHQQQHSVPINVAGGAVANAGPDGKVSYLYPLNSRLQTPTTTMVRLVNPSSLINTTAGVQAAGTPPPIMVGNPPIAGSPVTGTSGMGVRLTSPVRLAASPAGRGGSPVRPSMGASPGRGGRGISPVRAAGPVRGGGHPGVSSVRGGGSVRGAGPPGGGSVRGAGPPGGRGGGPPRGAPGARMIRPPMRGRGGVRMRGAPGGPLLRGMRPRMPMGRGAPGMRGARPPLGRGAPRGPRPGGPVRPPGPGNPAPPVVRADPANLPPAPKPKKIKVEVVDLSDEDSPPPTPANPALDRLKHCGISVSRQKAPTIPKGLKLPPGISLSPAPTGYSAARKTSDAREAGGSGSSSYSIRPATEEPAKAPAATAQTPSGTIKLDTLTPEQRHQLKLMGII